MSPTTTTVNTCENCAYWIKVTEDLGICNRYAPKPEVFIIQKTPERPMTHIWWWACGDWKKKV